MQDGGAAGKSSIKLSARNLSKNFNGFPALKNVSFGVEEGEIFGLLGPNGAGKSTCMKIFCGLLAPSMGQAIVDGVDVALEPISAKSRIGYLPEYPALFEHLTGREFLAMIGKFRDIVDQEIDRRIARLNEVLDLEGKIDELIGTYSKGMRQKIAFGSAIIHNPPILILDEPTSGLDPRFARYVKDIIKEFGKQKKTILMSTHITEVAQNLCSRIAIINKGEIAIEGTAEEIKRATNKDSLEDAFIEIVGGRLWTGSIF
ncbi:MAG: ABC transporter ATP-binding protein, partial [Thermoplasmata archaeon]